MRYALELYPGHFFLEKKTGDGNWHGLSHDNDSEVMETRYAYQLEMQTPGTSVRLIDHKGKVLHEHTS